MYKKTRILIVFLFVYSLLNAQPSILIKPIPDDNQLPSSSVPRIFQDKEGFLWFGTLDGLCRHDGSRLHVFRSDSKNPNLLSNNEITYIAEDSNNHLWIGTRKGMNILDKANFKITPFNTEELTGQPIRWIHTASDKTIWVGAGNKLLRYKPDFSLIKDYKDSFSYSSINSIYEDKDHNLWVMMWRNGLFKYNPEQNSFEKMPPIGTEDNPFRMYQDNWGNHWIATWGDGVFQYNPNGKEDIYIPQKVEKKEVQSEENHFFGIVQDNKYEYIWLLSSSGLYALRYDDDNRIEEVDVSYLFTEFNNIYSDIIKDNKGNLWIGTFSEGVFSINFDQPQIKNYPIASIKKQIGFTTRITSLHEDTDGDIWINQDRRGLGIYNPATEQVSFFQEHKSLQGNNAFISVSCFEETLANPGQVWVGSEYYPVIYILKKEKDILSIGKEYDLSRYTKNPGNPRKFHEDKRGNVWIVTSAGLLFKPFDADTIIPVSFSLGEITDITEDSYGNIWTSSRNYGIFSIPTQRDKGIDEAAVVNYNKNNSILESNNAEAIHADVNGNIWIGTKEGSVFLYSMLADEFQDITHTFNMINEGIFNILSDYYGHIWISTNKRIVEFNPRNRVTKEYSIADAEILVNSFVANSYCINKNGEILYGGNKGISAFTPSEKITRNSDMAKVYITDVKINNQSLLEENPDGRLDVMKLQLTINPEDKNIEIYFSSLDYNNPHKVIYAYKLNGVDNDWVYTSGSRQFAVYNQLKKGNYTFSVKAMDENGLWSDRVTNLELHKRPALYETWWAYLIYTLIAFTILRLIYKFGKNRIELRNDLRITQIEKEKTEELTQMKLRYFTNISHDFLTPLTILSCLIDDAEMNFKGQITQFDAMRSNINRLRRLLQQVLDFRKVESGNMKLKISNGDIVLFIRDVCYTNFTPLMKKKNIEFTFHSTPFHIDAWFDTDKIDKIIFNLLSNAFKYTPDNGKVEVNLYKYDVESNSYLKIEIKDSGVGISREDINKIFTRFYSNKMNDAGKSNGIGLNLTKDLVELHHGAILVSSKAGEGSIFTVNIPIDKESYTSSDVEDKITILDKNKDIYLSDSSIEEHMTDTPIESQDRQVAIQVLLVEDNEELLHLMRNILSKQYTIKTATNGKEALALIDEPDNDIDIVISDVMMPEMDGLELCRALKKNIETCHIPIILLTAKNRTEDRIECYNAGADGYISKPFEMKVLEARISNFISNKRAKQQEFQANKEINITTLEYPSMDEEFLNKAIEIIEQNLSDSEFDVSVFAKELHLSKSTLYRKLKNMTGLSPVEFIRNIRLKHACQILKNQSIPISEVAYTVGFSDPNYFAQCFKTEFNITPKDYRKKN
ncbi:response regulator [Bacteroidales bacterium OttesenSCG-928-L03]|nr:response regulator [Bacteroidales bacterium OttesenSCG-928-L03]